MPQISLIIQGGNVETREISVPLSNLRSVVGGGSSVVERSLRNPMIAGSNPAALETFPSVRDTFS